MDDLKVVYLKTFYPLSCFPPSLEYWHSGKKAAARIYTGVAISYLPQQETEGQEFDPKNWRQISAYYGVVIQQNSHFPISLLKPELL